MLLLRLVLFHQSVVGFCEHRMLRRVERFGMESKFNFYCLKIVCQSVSFINYQICTLPCFIKTEN